MAVANHPLCEPVRFAHYKALVPIREVDGIVYVSGHGPEDINTYEPLYRGRVGTDLTLEDGYNAAAECAKTLLRAVQQRYGSLDCIHHLVRATALVNCGEGFTQPEKVVDGFSDTCMEILQERGYHTRTIMGTHNMPNHNIPVEVEMIFVLADRYPYAEELYQMADEEGFLIIDEVPAVGFMQSTMNFLAANQGNGKKVGYFEKETTPKLLENHKTALTDMITRDKNHASVIAWSILNEPQCTSEGTEAYFKPLFDLAHELDPQKRPRTYAIVMMSLPNNSKGQQFADFISLNRYYGWYVMGGMCIVDAETAFRKEMDGWAQVLNGRPMIFTEYGADTMPSEHKLPSVMWSQEYQNEYLDMNHNVFDSYDFVQGELVWNFADFQTTEGIMRANGNKKGIFTRQRQPKDAAFHFRARWTSLPVDYKGNTAQF